MEYTRVDTAKLTAATDDLRAHLARLRPLLEPLLVTSLTDAERTETLRASPRILQACRHTVENADQFPKLLAATGYDGAAVEEDLENIQALAGLSELLQEFKQWIDDSQLVWGGEVYHQTLTLYNTGKALSKTDGSVRPLIDPLADVFAARRKKAPRKTA